MCYLCTTNEFSWLLSLISTERKNTSFFTSIIIGVALFLVCRKQHHIISKLTRKIKKSFSNRCSLVNRLAIVATRHTEGRTCKQRNAIDPLS